LPDVPWELQDPAENVAVTNGFMHPTRQFHP
jgi:hypothetical protein